MNAIARTTISFDRKIEIEWLDAVAGCVAAGQAPGEVRKFLLGFLEGAVAGDSVHRGRGKTLTVLSRIWLTVPEHALPLRKAALQCIGSATSEERVAIHWAMAIGTYPFFCDVAANVGKLLALNGHANLSQVGRRMTESWGDRSTLPRAIQRVLRSMVQWGAVREGPAKGTFVADQIGELLLRAVLVSHGRGMSLSQLTGHPSLFPFGIHLSATAMRKSGCIQVQREGDQSDFIDLGQGSRRQR